LGELTVRVNELSVTMTNLNNDKRRLEGDLANLQAELEEALAARRAAEDRADRTQMEMNRLVEELRQVCHCPCHVSSCFSLNCIGFTYLLVYAHAKTVSLVVLSQAKAAQYVVSSECKAKLESKALREFRPLPIIFSQL